MKKRILSLLMCLCLAASLLPGTALAVDTSPATSVTIYTYTDGEASSTQEILNAVSPYYVDGKAVSPDTEPSGYTAKFEPQSGNTNAKLILKDLNLTNGCLFLTGTLDIVLEGTNTITRTTASYGESNKNAAVYTNICQLTILGTGSLTATGPARGLYIGNDSTLTVAGGTVTGVATGNNILDNAISGIEANNSAITVNGGTLEGKATANSNFSGLVNGICSLSSGLTVTKGDVKGTATGSSAHGVSIDGTVTMSNGSVTGTGTSNNETQSNDCGIIADSYTISGGTMTGTGTKNAGISVWGNEENGTFQVTGGTVKGTGGQAGISTGSALVTVSGEGTKVEGIGKNAGLSVGNSLTVESGTVTGTNNGTDENNENNEIGRVGLEANTLTLKGGTATGTAPNQGIILGNFTMSGGTIVGKSTNTNTEWRAPAIIVSDSKPVIRGAFQYKTAENGDATTVADPSKMTDPTLEELFNGNSYLSVQFTGTAPETATVTGVKITPEFTSQTSGIKVHKGVSTTTGGNPGWARFQAEVLGTNYPAQGVTWTVTGSNLTGDQENPQSRTYMSNGALTVSPDETATTLTVTATSTVDTTKSASITVTVVDSNAHEWDTTHWHSNETHHWHSCYVGGCNLAHDSSDNGDYGAHTLGSDGRCTVCAGGNSGEPDPTPPTPTPPSGGGSSSSGTTTPDKPVTNPDGSTTTTTEDKTTGTVTETTKKPDGSQTVVETQKDGTVTTKDTDKDGNKTETVAKPDGSSVTKVEQTDGTTANVSTDTSGKVEAEVALPAAVVDQAQKEEKPVALPIPEVKATASAETAPVVTVKTGSADPVKVEIPTADVTPGTVAVIVNADGSEEVIKTSVPTENGLTVALPDGATVKIVDNSKSFADVPTDSWAADAVNFSASRELFSGTGVDSFSPEEPMTRAMLMTVLARFDGADTSGGDTWYEKGMDWAVANGVSDGSAPDGNISREQLAVMLWRYSGSPAPSGSLDGFTDAGAVSGYAQEAMLWAVENGVVSGFGDGTLAPQGQATRAQVAQMMKNFITK